MGEMYPKDKTEFGLPGMIISALFAVTNVDIMEVTTNGK